MISENHFTPIAALDLDPIKVKLMHEESGEGWSLAYADAVEFEYRRFLYLAKWFPDEQAAPLFDVDVFWHYHILDTMKYAADCDAVFGYFLHHFPYVGLRGADDLETHRRVGERMRELYEQTYGELYDLPRERANARAGNHAAFSIPSSAPLRSDRRGQAAFSLPVAQITVARPAATAAFSIPSKLAFSMPAIKTIDRVRSGPVAAARFNAARPTLTRES